MKWYIRFLFTLAFLASWVTLIFTWDEPPLILTIIGMVCTLFYTVLFVLILIDLFSEFDEALDYRKSIQSRRLRYSLFRQKVKSEPIEFESEARKVIK